MDTLTHIKHIQQIQGRFGMISGITMGFLMIVYFFTFALLIDNAYYYLLSFEAITTLLFVGAFIFLNRISFAYVKIRCGKNEPYKSLIAQMQPYDVSIAPEDVAQRIDSQASS